MKTQPTLNRRDFVKHTTLTALAAAALPAVTSFAAPAEGKKLPWKFCAFEKPLLFLNYDDTADVFAELGFDGIEAAVRPGGHVVPERVEEDLPRFVEALKKRGLEITVLTSNIGQAEQPHAEKTLRTAARLGIKRYRMDWWRYDLKQPILPQLEALRPRLKELAALNRSLGITGLYQNHAGANMVGAPLWDIYSLIRDQDTKDVALAFDIRHATVEGGLAWPIQFQLVKSHIGVVYFKDFVWEDRRVKNVPLGAGLVDPKFGGVLRSSGFAGPISLHVEYGSPRELKDRAFLDAGKSASSRGEGTDRDFFTDAFRKDFAKLREWLAA